MTPRTLVKRDVYEQPYTLNGLVVLTAIDSHGAYAGHELVGDEAQYQAALGRLRQLLDDRDPLPAPRLTLHG